MTELKTLKDIEIELGHQELNQSVLYPTRLRQEAIKWYKKWLETHMDDLDMWKDFFNLTEEDLK